MHIRTFNVTRLYYKFLKPKKLSNKFLNVLIERLYFAQFIILHPQNRFSETSKLIQGQHKKELFKIIERLPDA